MLSKTEARPGCTLDILTGLPAKGRPAAAIIPVERRASDDFDRKSLTQIALGAQMNMHSYRTTLPPERVLEDGFFNRSELAEGDLVFVQAGEPPTFFFLAIGAIVAKHNNGGNFSDVVTVPVGLPAGFFGKRR